MAEIAVQAVIQLLAPFISDEVRLINGLNEDVKIIADVLVSTSTFVESAEERAIGDKEAKHWVRQVRSLAYDIEDVIEEYQLYEKDSAWGKLWKYTSLSVRCMATNVKSLRERAVQMDRARKLYRPLSNNNNITEQATSTFTMRMCVPQTQCEVVGVEVPKREVFDLLIRLNHHNARSTVAVVGMRGVGKTTLVHCVCNDPNIRGQFPMRAMISMSPALRRGSVGHNNARVGILRSMMKQFYEADKVNHFLDWIKSLDLASLEHQIKKCLMNTRYLVVFDDVREGDTEMMNYLKQLLPINNKSSKILVTTRDENVARAWLDKSSDRPYKLKILPPEKAWVLFCKFQTYDGSKETCSPYLEQLARGIVQKCDGLPPAIVAIGRLLSTKSNDFNEWRKVHDNLAHYLQQNSRLTGVYDILTRNYYDVPCDLKPCFLYFGVFPKRYAVKKMRLIRLWIAEGFITKNVGVNLTLEDVAEENLERLISQSFVEVKDRDPIDQRPKTLRVNEFLHEILISKLDELRFCQILSERCCCAGDEQPYRRLSIQKFDSACEVLQNTTTTKSNIRSLFDFELTQDILAKVVTTTFLNNNVLLLKVLDLCCAPISDVPLSLGNLRNLRYLSLRKTRVEKLPGSIGMLQDLQTLDLKHTKISVLPNEINNLHMLRHLLIYMYLFDFQYSPLVSKVNGVRIPGRALKNFRELQKLAYLDLGNGMTKVTHCKELRKLTRLAIIGLKSKDGKDLCVVLHEMNNLQALTVYAKDSEMLDLDHFDRASSPPPQTLKRLYLNGPLKGFPRWIFDLHNLMKIRLRWSNLNDHESLDNLGALPNLVELQLLEAHNGILLEFTGGGFKKLKILCLLDLHALESLVINEAALPVLEELAIGESPRLQIPLGIQYLHNLKKLTFFNMPFDFTDLILPGQKYYYILKPTCDVSLKFKSPQGYWTS